ncbi:MAG TPA: penicillin-binding protein 2 [Deltaproteobacteria bacterium]|nr:penicillin-binding protein 2 [Deltaproteobacteria bacterium]
MSHNLTGPELEEALRWKAKMLMIFVFVLFCILLLRLVNMQIFNGSYYEGLSSNNRIRIVSINATRGKILDRNKEVLADNRPAYNLKIMPEDIRNVHDISGRLGLLLEQNNRDIIEKITQSKMRPYDPVTIARDISFDQVARIEAELFTLPGVSIDATNERDYVFKDLASHILGFLGEISRKELQRGQTREYVSGDLIGKTGIEFSCEDELRGVKGARVFEVDALGRKIKILSERPAVPGNDIVLTIDKRLQLVAKESLRSRSGAVVALVPSTGEVLVMTSSPGYDPNMFMSPMAPEAWKQISEDPLHPLENRAIRGQYPPASIFKVVVAIAGLATKTIAPQEKIFCPGDYTLGANTYRCWKTDGHGDISMVRAISESCDVYFYKLGEMLGIDRISKYASDLGFGKPTGIELRDELSGINPTRQWKQKRFGSSWKPGDTIITSIGQGYNLVTPLQVAKAMSALVNGGRLYKPSIIVSQGEHLEGELEFGKADLDIIKAGLRSVVDGELGTARHIHNPMFAVGGKTGTAQVARGYSSKLPDESDLPYHLRDHAWFFGFSPVETPEILVVAVVEHGGHGGSIAAPIVRDVIKEFYFLKGMEDEQIREDN